MSEPLLSRHKLRRYYRIGLAIVVIVIALFWQQIQAPQGTLLTSSETPPVASMSEPIQPIPTDIAVDPDKFALGEKLFRDPRLSRNGAVSCLSCHKFEAGGAEHTRFSTGVKGALNKVNTPTVFNVAYNFHFNWDGEHPSLAAHTSALIQDPIVMDAQWSAVTQKLGAINDYQQAFESIYDDGINKDTVINALVTYEAALTTPNAPFDQYLNGDESALSAAEKEGYGLFKAYGCISCHQGVNIGGNMFQKFGVLGDYFADRGNVVEADLGRFNVTGEAADRYVFRVPSLRNVSVTPPYFHDGQAETLEEAIKIMVKYQLGRPIPNEHVEQISQFLTTLTGEYKGVPLHSTTLHSTSLHSTTGSQRQEISRYGLD